MADIYTMDGEEITMGLQGSSVCDEAIQAAKGIAADRGECVRLEDDGEVYDVHPDGRVDPGEPWGVHVEDIGGGYYEAADGTVVYLG